MAISHKVAAYIVDPLERAGRTFGQQFVVFLATAGSVSGLLTNQHWLTAVQASLFAAAISILTSVLTFWVPAQSPYADLLLRVIKTFAQSVGGIMLASVTTGTHASLQGAIAVALPVAGTALLLGLAAIGVPGTAGASLLPVTVNPAPLGTDAGSVPAIEDADPISDDTVAPAPPDPPFTVAEVGPDADSLSPDEAKAAVLKAKATPDPAAHLDSLNVSDGPTVVSTNPTRNPPAA